MLHQIIVRLSFVLVLIVSASFFQNVFAQTITLGEGTAINGIRESSPINIWGRKAVCQMVYTADEMIEAGAVAGPINKLGFFVSNNPIHNIPDYQIQIKHTTAPNAGGFLEGGYTTVKTIGSYAPAVGWDMLDMDTPFEWDGVSNIVVRICFSRVNPSRDPSGQLRIYDATNGYKYFRRNTGGSACGNVPNTILNTKPQIRLVFQTETVWTGLVSTDWFNASNWSASVPDQTIDVIIPGGTPFNPTLSGGTGKCKNLTVSGDLTLTATGVLNVYENFVNTGNFVDNGGITDFVGLASHQINTVSDLTIMNLRSSSSAGLEIVAGNVIIGSELRVNKGLFNTGDALTIRSDAEGTARIDKLRTTCTYTLNMTDTWGDGWNGGFITVFENGEEIGEFFAVEGASSATFQIETGGTLALTYTAGSFENENAYTLSDEGGSVIFSDGTTPATGAVFSSVASGCTFSSSIIGDIKMERYIDAGETFWRYFASAVKDPALSQYLDDFTTAGFPGSPFPDFPFISIYSYDETRPPSEGYVPAASTDEIIEVGQGYQVWCGDTITGTEPFLVDLVGEANQGDIALPVTYTPSGTPSEDGWSFIGNPYASTIDWDSPSWTKVNIANATYIQDPDTRNYATYISGASTNGGSRYIASQQSFWVNATAASPQLILREGAKSNVDIGFKSGDAPYSPGMTIQLAGDAVQTDEVVLRHIEGASDEFEREFDATKLYGGWGVNPQLVLLNSAEKELSIHSIDKGYAEWAIPMKTVVFSTGLYRLTFLNTNELDVPCMKLEDTYTGLFYSIEEGTTLEFELYDTTISPRFLVHLGRAYYEENTNISCVGAADGMFTLDLDVDEELSYQLVSGDSIETFVGVANPLLISGLKAGGYDLILADFDSFCEDSLFSFTIEDADSIFISSTVTEETMGEDGSVELEVSGGVPPYTFSWSNEAVTQYIYGLTEGEYSVLITDANHCEEERVYYVGSSLVVEENDEVEDHKDLIFYDELNKQIKLKVEGEASVSLYSVTGQLIEVYKLDNTAEFNVLSLPTNLTNGVYFIKGNTQDLGYKFVYY